MVIVSAIGHETDTPLCDYAADRRGSTPTQGIEIIVTERDAEIKLLSGHCRNLNIAVSRKFENELYNFDSLMQKFENIRINFIKDQKENFRKNIQRVSELVKKDLAEEKNKFEYLRKQLLHLQFLLLHQ